MKTIKALALAMATFQALGLALGPIGMPTNRTSEMPENANVTSRSAATSCMVAHPGSATRASSANGRAKRKGRNMSAS